MALVRHAGIGRQVFIHRVVQIGQPTSTQPAQAGAVRPMLTEVGVGVCGMALRHANNAQAVAQVVAPEIGHLVVQVVMQPDPQAGVAVLCHCCQVLGFLNEEHMVGATHGLQQRADGRKCQAPALGQGGLPVVLQHQHLVLA